MAAPTQASTDDIIASLSASLAALCDQAAGSRFGACQELSEMLAHASNELRAARPAVARQLLRVLASAADVRARQGAITAAEGTMISGTATYLATRV